MVDLRVLLSCFVIGIAIAVAPETLADPPLFNRRPLEVRNSLPARRVLSCQDTLSLVQIAELPPTGGGLVFGDTDHDGRNEIIYSWRDESFNFFLRILEEQGNNLYTLEYQGPQLAPSETGDFDQDSKSEILGQFGTYLQIYESPDATSHPSRLSWSLDTGSNFFTGGKVKDTDRDGRMEIIIPVYGLGLLIYENTGDNSFAQVFFVAIDISGPLIADFDGDGLMEIAFGNGYERIHVFESPENNAWEEVWADSTEIVNTVALKGGRDTDGNGVPELFVMGNGPGPQGTSWTTVVYEASGDNQLAAVDTIQIYDAYTGSSINALGDLDGIFPEEYVMRGGRAAWVFRPKRPGQWEFFQEIERPKVWHHGLYIHDVNQNGRGELFWTTSANASSLVFEHSPPPPTSSVTESSGPWHGPLTILPNPCRVEATLLLQRSESAAAYLAVYDVAGRLVERKAVVRGPSGHIVWRTASRSAGVYFLRLEDRAGTPIGSGRGLVVR